MRIGIDISQIAFPATGVSNFIYQLVTNLIKQDSKNQYILFGSSLRQRRVFYVLQETLKLHKNVQIKIFPFPPTVLEFIWNRMHILPIELLVGNIDVFLSSDWVQPPTKAKNATILYDLIIYKYPKETHEQWKFSLKNLIVSPNIVASQKRRLQWVKRECDVIMCISEATKKDAKEILGIDEKKLRVVYPGV